MIANVTIEHINTDEECAAKFNEIIDAVNALNKAVIEMPAILRAAKKNKEKQK